MALQNDCLCIEYHTKKSWDKSATPFLSEFIFWNQKSTNSWRQLAMKTKLHTVVSIICGYSGWTSFMLKVSHREFWCASYIFRKCVHPCLKSYVLRRHSAVNVYLLHCRHQSYSLTKINLALWNRRRKWPVFVPFWAVRCNTTCHSTALTNLPIICVHGLLQNNDICW